MHPTKQVLSLFVIAIFAVSTQIAAAADEANAKGQVYWIDTDVGGDVDDAYALLLASHIMGDSLVGVSTTGIRAKEKQAIAARILTALGQENIPVHAGAGPVDETSQAFFKRYRTWPFGDPYQGGEKPMAFQGKAYEHLPLPEKLSETAGSNALAHAIDTYGQDLRLVTLGPLTNLGELVHRYPSKLGKLGSVFMMGGLLGKRLGYNTVIDLDSSATAFKELNANQVHTRLIGGDIGQDPTQFVLRHDVELPLFENASDITPLGRALIEDTRAWHKYFARGKASTVDAKLADPVAVWLAVHPEQLAEAGSVHLQLRPERITKQTTMLSKDAANLFRIHSSNTKMSFASLKKNTVAQVSKSLVEILRKPFYPSLPANRWHELVDYWIANHSKDGVSPGEHPIARPVNKYSHHNKSTRK